MNRTRTLSGCRRLLALAALICALGAALAGVASAQDPDEPDELPPDELAPGELRGVISAEPGELFQIEWGGGSLYDLKRRLAVRGCMLDLLWRQGENEEWHGYSQYRVPPSLQRDFLDRYEADVPAGTLHAACFDICTFQYETETIAAYDPRCRTAAEALSDGQNDASSLCTEEFDPLVIEHAMPLLPRRPDLCIVRIEYDLEAEQANDRYDVGVSGALLNQYDDDAIEIGARTWYETYPNRQPAILITSPRNPAGERAPGIRAAALHAEAHELCHATQDWIFLQSINQHRRQTQPLHEWWDQSEAGREFAAAVGFSRAETGRWALADDRFYRFAYGSDHPAELAAELCAVYLIERMGQPGAYSFLAYDIQRRAYYWRTTPIEFDPDWFLKPLVRQWLEKYMILLPAGERMPGS